MSHQGKPKLVPGLAHPSVPVNPNGTGHCPECGAHANMWQKVCQAPDCEEVSRKKYGDRLKGVLGEDLLVELRNLEH